MFYGVLRVYRGYVGYRVYGLGCFCYHPSPAASGGLSLSHRKKLPVDAS